MIEKIISDNIYQVLRNKLVAEGFLPDTSLLNDLLSSDVDLVKAAKESYKTLLVQIKSDKGFTIGLYPYGSSQEKGEKKVPRIVIDIHNMLPSDVGNDPSQFYELITEPGGVQHFIRKKSYNLLSNLTFCIYAVCNTAEQMFTLNKLILSALPHRDYMKPFSEEQLLPYNNFFTVLRDKGKTEDLNEGIMERYYIYEVMDLEEMESIIISGENITPINEIALLTENN